MSKRTAAALIRQQKRTDAMNMIEVGDLFTDPLDGETRRVASKGMLIMGMNGKLPHWDDSVFCTDGGCAGAEEVFDNLIL